MFFLLLSSLSSLLYFPGAFHGISFDFSSGAPPPLFPEFIVPASSEHFNIGFKFRLCLPETESCRLLLIDSSEADEGTDFSLKICQTKPSWGLAWAHFLEQYGSHRFIHISSPIFFFSFQQNDAMQHPVADLVVWGWTKTWGPSAVVLFIISVRFYSIRQK